MKLWPPIAAVAALAVLSAVAFAASRETDEQRRAGAVAENAIARSASSNVSQVGHEPAPSGFDPTTIEQRGSFRSSTGDVLQVFDGDLLSTDPLADVIPKDDNRPRRCVRTVDREYASTVCDAKPLFQSSNLLFGQTASGGPDPRERTEYFISGLASARVGRIDAVTTEGVISVQVSKKLGFFFELTRDQLARGVTVTLLEVYGKNGSLIESISL
jgi:hypothetical protein